MTFGGILKNSNGTDYAHNYDLIVKWFANVLRGETLEVIGVKTGRIEEVFGFEPAEIRVMCIRKDYLAALKSLLRHNPCRLLIRAALIYTDCV